MAEDLTPFSLALLKTYTEHRHLRDRKCTSSDTYKMLQLDPKTDKASRETTVTGCKSCAADNMCKNYYVRFRAKVYIHLPTNNAMRAKYQAEVAWVQNPNKRCVIAVRATKQGVSPQLQLIFFGGQSQQNDDTRAFVQELRRWPGQLLWKDLDGYCKYGWYFWNSWGAHGIVWNPSLLTEYTRPHNCHGKIAAARPTKKPNAGSRTCHLNIKPVKLLSPCRLSLPSNGDSAYVAASVCVEDGEVKLVCQEEKRHDQTKFVCTDLEATKLFQVGALELSAHERGCARMFELWDSWPKKLEPLGACPREFEAALSLFLTHEKTASCDLRCANHVIVSLPPRLAQIELKAYRKPDKTAALQITIDQKVTVDVYEFLQSEGSVDQGPYWRRYIELALTYDSNDWLGFLQICPCAQALIQKFESLVLVQQQQQSTTNLNNYIHKYGLAQPLDELVQPDESWSPIEVQDREDVPVFSSKLLTAYQEHKHLGQPVCTELEQTEHTLRTITAAGNVRSTQFRCCQQCAAELKCGGLSAEFGPQFVFNQGGRQYNVGGVVVADNRCYLVAAEAQEKKPLTVALKEKVTDNPRWLQGVLRTIRKTSAARLWQDMHFYCSVAYDFWSSWGIPSPPWQQSLLDEYAMHVHRAATNESDEQKLCRQLVAVVAERSLRLRVQPGVGAAELVTVVGAKLVLDRECYDIEFAGQRDGGPDAPLLRFRRKHLSPVQLAELVAAELFFNSMDYYCQQGSLFWNAWRYRPERLRGPAYNKFHARLKDFIRQHFCGKMGCRHKTIVATPYDSNKPVTVKQTTAELAVSSRQKKPHIQLAAMTEQAFPTLWITLEDQKMSLEQFLLIEEHWRLYINISKRFNDGAWMRIDTICERGLDVVRSLESLIKQVRDLPYRQVLDFAMNSGGAQPREEDLDFDYGWRGLS